jgi:hypothetical protein
MPFFAYKYMPIVAYKPNSKSNLATKKDLL